MKRRKAKKGRQLKKNKQKETEDFTKLTNIRQNTRYLKAEFYVSILHMLNLYLYILFIYSLYFYLFIYYFLSKELIFFFFS